MYRLWRLAQLEEGGLFYSELLTRARGTDVFQSFWSNICSDMVSLHYHLSSSVQTKYLTALVRHAKLLRALITFLC